MSVSLIVAAVMVYIFVGIFEVEGKIYIHFTAISSDIEADSPHTIMKRLIMICPAAPYSSNRCCVGNESTRKEYMHKLISEPT